MDNERFAEEIHGVPPPAEPPYEAPTLSDVEPPQPDSAFLQSLSASMPRGSDHMSGYIPPDRHPRSSRTPFLPQHHAYLEESNSGMGLDRLASLRMDSGDLTEARMVPDTHPAQRMIEPYGMRPPWLDPPSQPLPPEGMHPVKGPRALRYEDEVSGPGMYGPSFGRPDRPDSTRGHHLGGAMSDPYMPHAIEHYMLTPKFPSRSRNRASHYSATDYSSFDPQMAEAYRDGKRRQADSRSGLQRSASEGLRVRETGPPRPNPRPHSAQLLTESSTNSGKPPARKELSSSGPSGANESPDFAMIYAFLGSMFDPVCHMINHADVMQQMAAIDRETTILILENCVHNLDTPYFLESYLGQIRAVSRGGPMRPPPSPSGYERL